MQDLRVIGVEDGALLVASDEGMRFRIAIDEVLVSKLQQAAPEPSNDRKLAPREIQAQIRSGMSAQDVASTTGVPLEYIQRFEGPVLAEREYVVRSALDIPVHTAMDTDPMSQGATFGTVIRERLGDLGVVGERWASWKETGGWVVKLAFTAEHVDHDARWRYEPKKAALAPLNSEAITLSQQGGVAGALIPRLRAVGGDERVADSSRFDSGAFTDSELSQADTAPQHDRVPYRLTTADEMHAAELHSGSSPAVINRAPDDGVQASSQTADLLDALRRRRGEREAAALADEDDPILPHPSSGGMHLVDIPLVDFDDESGIFPTAAQPISTHSRGSKKGRATMPSWDEIVFGARPDDDPA